MGARDQAASDGGRFTSWLVVKGEQVDTATAPDWLRTGYQFFPYATNVAGQAWVLRANHYFPEHDLCTLFIDGRAVAEVTSGPDDPRPLLASIGSLRPICPWQLPDIPLMPATLARNTIDVVAAYVAHGSEWGDPCDLCEFAARDPYSEDPQPGSGR
jgi:hypothetical protein